jgi:three-Cys-motif partner protein
LFHDLPEHLAPGRISQAIRGQVWTEQKASLIARYLRYFVYITKHGAYIDGFGAPKEEENPHTWAAKLVLESEPRWLRQFYLCDLPDRAPLLERLAATQPIVAKRTVEVFPGDFNITVHDVLKSPLISGKTATFCLLDQFSTECHWKTVEALARHKGNGFNKIELFYFLAAGWIFRSLDGFKDHSIPSAWWGRPDWESLKGLSQNRLAVLFTQRFQKEFGYRFVNAWPIYKEEGGRGRIMFYMIHASDHPQAPILMHRAYENIVQPLETDEQLQLQLGGGDFSAGHSLV